MYSLSLCFPQVVNAEQHVEPVAYQVSDQCVCLERDNVFGPSNDIGLLSIRKPKSQEFLPGLMYKNKLMNPGEMFLPDELIVKTVVSAPLKSTPFFKNAKFPFVGTVSLLKSMVVFFLFYHVGHILSFRDDYNSALSDFNVLIHLPLLIGLQSTLNICAALKGGKSIGITEKQTLERAIKLN